LKEKGALGKRKNFLPCGKKRQQVSNGGGEQKGNVGRERKKYASLPGGTARILLKPKGKRGIKLKVEKYETPLYQGETPSRKEDVGPIHKGSKKREKREGLHLFRGGGVPKAPVIIREVSSGERGSSPGKRELLRKA